jgi:hypothetical protein
MPIVHVIGPALDWQRSLSLLEASSWKCRADLPLQVCFSRGPQASNSMVQHYGFLAEENEHDVYTF